MREVPRGRTLWEKGMNLGGGGLSLRSCPLPQAQSSPSGAERLNTITREMGPSCRIVHVCRTSVGEVGGLRALSPAPSPLPGPHPSRHLGFAGPRGQLGHNRSDNQGRRVAGMCRGGCGRQAKGRWWVGGWTAGPEGITGSWPHILPPKEHPPPSCSPGTPLGSLISLRLPLPPAFSDLPESILCFLCDHHH